MFHSYNRLHVLKTICMWIYLPVLWAKDQ